MIKQWEFMEKFKKQDEKFQTMRDRYWQKERDAKEHVKNLRSQYEACIHRELKEGKDCTTEKDKLRTQIVDAEKAAELAEQERVQAYQYIADESMADRITVAHLATDYRENYIPAVRKERLDPILERMEKARLEYYNCVLDIQELKDDYHPLYSSFYEMVRGYFSSGKHGATPVPMQVVEQMGKFPLIIDSDLSSIQSSRKLPIEMPRKKTELDSTAKN